MSLCGCGGMWAPSTAIDFYDEVVAAFWAVTGAAQWFVLKMTWANVTLEPKKSTFPPPTFTKIYFFSINSKTG